ncbi:MAG: di-trans,poly-cis-decaprenylcistransferase [Proteobacteria bacterium]|nr:di-trans,poly-cis-decaprenylcistransferase [Pseudomonadota bacterium]
MPKHIAIIMDGNGRWARRQHLPRLEGHRAGAKSVRMVVEECRRLGVRYLTLFTFSTENWQRPAEEVSGLMKLLQRYLESELALLVENGIRLRAMGDLSRLSPGVRKVLERTIASTSDHSEMELILALSYGGRQEIAEAARRIAQRVQAGELAPESVTEDTFAQHLFLPEVPSPELLIRTSDENRISNFMLWQVAYTEIVVTPTLWPDFSREEFHRCLSEFAGRERRFGLTQEQVDVNIARTLTGSAT